VTDRAFLSAWSRRIAACNERRIKSPSEPDAEEPE
jgi:hypothetical protein